MDATAEDDEASSIGATEDVEGNLEFGEASSESVRSGEKETDEELLARLGLPAPESLSKGDDFSGFMSRAVPEHLRRRALRRLWRSNPVLAVLDGLNDYDDDFTGGGVAPGTLKSAYEVGKGFIRQSETVESGEDLPQSPDGAAISEAAAFEEPPETAPVLAPSEDEDPEPYGKTDWSRETEGHPSDSEPNGPSRRTSRRMAFRISESD